MVRSPRRGMPSSPQLLHDPRHPRNPRSFMLTIVPPLQGSVFLTSLPVYGNCRLGRFSMASEPGRLRRVYHSLQPKNRYEFEQEATETTEAQEVGLQTSRAPDSPGR